MKVQIVTGYVPIPNHPRSAEVYGELGEKLAQVRAAPIKSFYSSVPECWLYKTLKALEFDPTHSEGDNPQKNSLAYHIVQHQKTQWLAKAAAKITDADTFVWLDYGIFSLPGVTKEIIEDFIGRVKKNDLAIPGCWDKGPVSDNHPCWRFCGSMLIVPRQWVDQLNFAVKTVCFSHLQLIRNVTWEVNTWAGVERTGKLPIRWYKADHNETMFTNYPGDTDDGTM